LSPDQSCRTIVGRPGRRPAGGPHGGPPMGGRHPPRQGKPSGITWQRFMNSSLDNAGGISWRRSAATDIAWPGLSSNTGHASRRAVPNDVRLAGRSSLVKSTARRASLAAHSAQYSASRASAARWHRPSRASAARRSSRYCTYKEFTTLASSEPLVGHTRGGAAREPVDRQPPCPPWRRHVLPSLGGPEPRIVLQRQSGR
jgi:hypothetical protein